MQREVDAHRIPHISLSLMTQIHRHTDTHLECREKSMRTEFRTSSFLLRAVPSNSPRQRLNTTPSGAVISNFNGSWSEKLVTSKEPRRCWPKMCDTPIHFPTNTRMHACTHARTHARTHAQANIHARARTHTHTQTQTGTHKHTHTHTHILTQTGTHTHIHTHTQTHRHTHTHARTHTTYKLVRSKEPRSICV